MHSELKRRTSHSRQYFIAGLIIVSFQISSNSFSQLLSWTHYLLVMLSPLSSSVFVFWSILSLVPKVVSQHIHILVAICFTQFKTLASTFHPGLF